MKAVAFALLLLPVCGYGMERFAALSMIETGDNDRAVGRAGEISRYQVRKAEWHSVIKSANYTDFETARRVTVRIMNRRLSSFRSHFGRQPTDFEFYGLWNAPSQVMKGRISHTVAARCRRFANLCASDPSPVQLVAANGS